jgi:NitT/TauT family transport system ATP-binding protein
MPQSDLLMPWRDALGNASVALENAGGGRRRARAEALPLFERLGLDGFERRRTWELSGGMRQRVAFARTLLAGKDVLLLDEPFGALDAITRAELQEWLRAALRDEPRTTVLVTHDVEEALLVCDRVAVMSARPGRVVLELGAGFGDGERTAAIASEAFVAARSRALGALR